MNAAKDEAHSYVFITRGWKTTSKKLLVLIHGSGAPRAGEWARKYVVVVLLQILFKTFFYKYKIAF